MQFTEYMYSEDSLVDGSQLDNYTDNMSTENNTVMGNMSSEGITHRQLTRNNIF